jgi:C4-dicarboxylate-binding protein DctP
MKLNRTKAFAGLAALSICLSAQAAESFRLITVDSDSSSSLWVRVFLEHFIPEVDRRLAVTDNYEIDWNPAFGGTIAKPRGVLTSLQYDLADIGIVTTPYHPDKIPFYSLPYITPFVSNDIGLISRTMTDLTNKYPQVKDGWEDYNIHYLTSAGSIDTYNIVLTDPVESIEDLLNHAQTVVIGNADPEFQKVFDLKRPEQVVIDLVRITTGKRDAEQYDGICW